MALPSPEQQTAAGLKDLRRLVSRIDPAEHAVGYLSMSGDEMADQVTLNRHAIDTSLPPVKLEDLASVFDRDYQMAKTYLAESWEVDTRWIPWPVDGSQNIAQYLARFKGEEYTVTVTRWLQPHPFTDDMEEMMGLCVDPQWSLSPMRHALYTGEVPLFSCKYDVLETPKHLASEWGDTELLTPEDVMIAGKVVKRISVRSI